MADSPNDTRVNIVKDGITGSVPESDLGQALDMGWRLENAEEADDRIEKEDLTGISGEVGAFGLGTLDALTLGSLGPEAFNRGEGRGGSRLAELNPKSFLTGQVTGLVGSTIAAPGSALGRVTALTPAGLVARAGAAAGATRATKLGRLFTQGAVEGGLYDASYSAAKTALEDEAGAETIFAAAAKGGLRGAALGGAFGAAARGAEKVGILWKGKRVRAAAKADEVNEALSVERAALEKERTLLDQRELGRVTAAQEAAEAGEAASTLGRQARALRKEIKLAKKTDQLSSQIDEVSDAQTKLKAQAAAESEAAIARSVAEEPAGKILESQVAFGRNAYKKSPKTFDSLASDLHALRKGSAQTLGNVRQAFRTTANADEAIEEAMVGLHSAQVELNELLVVPLGETTRKARNLAKMKIHTIPGPELADKMAVRGSQISQAIDKVEEFTRQVDGILKRGAGVDLKIPMHKLGESKELVGGALAKIGTRPGELGKGGEKALRAAQRASKDSVRASRQLGEQKMAVIGELERRKAAGTRAVADMEAELDKMLNNQSSRKLDKIHAKSRADKLRIEIRNQKLAIREAEAVLVKAGRGGGLDLLDVAAIADASGAVDIPDGGLLGGVALARRGLGFVGGGGKAAVAVDMISSLGGGKLQRAYNKVKNSIAKNVSSGLSKAGTVAPVVPKVAAVLSVSGRKKDADDAFRERAEFLSAVAEGDPGRLDGFVAPLGDIHPELPTRVGEVALRAYSYQLQTMPQDPGIGRMGAREPRWSPSKGELNRWSRIVETTEQPHRMVERWASGRAMPYEVDALAAVYPALHGQVKTRIMEEFSKKKSVEYPARVRASLLLGMPADSLLNPQLMQQIKASAAASQAKQSEGGIQVSGAVRTNEGLTKAQKLQE